MGVGGGYHLAKPPGDITFGHIVRILDGPLAPVKCVSQMAYEPCGCPDEQTCGLRLVMGDVRGAIKNSFAFGGENAVLVVRQPEEMLQ